MVVTSKVTREAEKLIMEQSAGGSAMVNLLEIWQGDHKARCAWDGPRILVLPWSSYYSTPFALQYKLPGLSISGEDSCQQKEMRL